jgi:hypothetical protein
VKHPIYITLTSPSKRKNNLNRKNNKNRTNHKRKEINPHNGGKLNRTSHRYYLNNLKYNIERLMGTQRQ